MSADPMVKVFYVGAVTHLDWSLQLKQYWLRNEDLSLSCKDSESLLPTVVLVCRVCFLAPPAGGR